MKIHKSIEWKPVKTKVFGDEKWVAKIHHLGTMSLEDIANEMADSSTSQSSEVEGLILAYINRIHFYVMKGRSVNVDGLGTFYPKLSTKMVADRNDVSVKNCIKTITVGFRPAATLSTELKKAMLCLHSKPSNKSDKEE